MKLPFKLPHKIEHRNRIMGLLIGAFLAAVFSLVYLSGLLKSIENFDLDMKFRRRQSITAVPANKDIVFLEIDDDTLLNFEKTFPDDPEYYVEIINKLGSDDIGAKGIVFSFDYSHPFGRKVKPAEGESLQGNLSAMAQFLDDNAALKSGFVADLTNLNEYLKAPDGAKIAKDAAEKLNTMVYDQKLTDVSTNLGKIGGFIDNYDFNSLAPDREKALAESFAKAKNIYMIYESKSHIPTPYGVEDLRNDPTARDIFVKIMRSDTIARPEDPKEGLVFDAYQNLKPADFDKLLAPGAGAFDTVVLARMKRDQEEKKADITEFVAQNKNNVFNMPPEVASEYTVMRHMKPVVPALGAVTAGQGVGRAEFTKDDGTLRMIAPAVIYDGKLYPHIDLLIAMKYLGVDRKNVEFHADRIILKNAVNPRTKVKQDIEIPLTESGDMLINWASVWEDTNTFPHKSLHFITRSIEVEKYYPTAKKYASMTQAQAAVLTPEQQAEMQEAQGFLRPTTAQERAQAERTMKKYEGMNDDKLRTLPQEQQAEFMNAQEIINNGVTEPEFAQADKEIKDLKGKIIILGRTAVGTAEINPTPLEPRYHYVGLHANAINTIIENQFVHNLSGAAVAGIFLLLAVSLGFTGGLIHTKSSIVTALINFLIMVGVAVGYSIFCIMAFAKYNLHIPMLVPIALIVLTFLFVFLYRFLTEEREKLKMKSMFSTYVNKEVVESLIENPDMLKLGGEWMECTVFFSDVAGFTSISESLKPEELVELLNEYLTAMTDIIFTYGGTLDKYIGDAIVAVYGAPIPFGDHAVKSCFATLDMQKKLAEMRTAWKEQGRHELTARCGINTGRMIAGNMGSTTRFNYTVMGDNVELGEHLESGGKTYNTVMTISEETKRQAGGQIITRLLDIIDYSGHDKPFRIYELMAKASDGISEETRKGIDAFEAGVDLYFKREWDKAIEKYNEVYKYIPGDPPTKKALERCEKMKANPPGPEFDELRTKVAPL